MLVVSLLVETGSSARDPADIDEDTNLLMLRYATSWHMSNEKVEEGQDERKFSKENVKSRQPRQ